MVFASWSLGALAFRVRVLMLGTPIHGRISYKPYNSSLMAIEAAQCTEL